MNPSFSSYLVNDVFGDPGVYVEVRWSKRALLFDLGHNDRLGPTRLLRANDIFISHTHLDHFIGFDAVLRVALGRGKTLRLLGPPGLINNVQGKLQGYTWNLVDGYPLTLDVGLLEPSRSLVCLFPGGTVPHQCEQAKAPRGGSAGRFLAQRRETYIWQGQPDEFRFTATLYAEHHREERELVLGEIKERFCTISRGQKIAYVVDARFDEENEAKIISLARDADVLYCESPYLDVDAEKARSRYHLTARQAGLMARRAQVRDLVVFHFSPRYTGQGDVIEREAADAFRG